MTDEPVWAADLLREPNPADAALYGIPAGNGLGWWFRPLPDIMSLEVALCVATLHCGGGEKALLAMPPTVRRHFVLASKEAAAEAKDAARAGALVGSP